MPNNGPRDSRMLGSAAFSKVCGISLQRLNQLLEKYVMEFDKVTRIQGQPRFTVWKWKPVVKKLLKNPKPQRRPNVVPDMDAPARDLPPANGEELLPGVVTGEADGQAAMSYTEARASRELYSARTAKMEYLRKSGKLVEIDPVEAVWKDIAISVQKAIMAVPDRTAPLVLGEVSVVKIRNVFREELRFALENLAFKVRVGDFTSVTENEENAEEKGTVVAKTRSKRGRKRKS